MKRITSWILALALLLALSGCSREERWQEQYDLGMRYLSEGNWEESILAFGQAIRVDSNRMEAYLGRADAYFQAGQLQEAEADYLAVLEQNNQLEEVWEKLSNLYLTMGDADRAAETLEQASNVLSSDALREAALTLRAEHFTDEDLLAFANEQAPKAVSLRYLRFGSYLSCDWDPSLMLQADGKWWFPVDDERAQTLKEAEAVWHEVYASDVPAPLDAFREFDGRLYTSCEGVGSDISLIDRALIRVRSRDGRNVVLTGYVTRLGLDANGNEYEYRDVFLYSMVFGEDGWKCVLCEEGDSISDEIPDDQEQFPDYFNGTYWHLNVSSGNGGNYYARFYPDGTYSYIHLITLDTGIGGYEYDGQTLYLNGVAYTGSKEGFASVESYTVMGATDWHYSLTPDPNAYYEELMAQRSEGT